MYESFDLKQSALPPSGSGWEGRVLRAIRRIIRSVDIYSRQLDVDCGVTVPQLSCLLRVVESGSVTLKALALAVNLSPSTLVGIVDRLEHKGLVRRERSKTDRRQVFITATEEGGILAAASPPPLQDRLSAALRRLPESEQVAIAASLEKIVDLMEISQIDAAPILDTGVSLGDPDQGLPPATLDTGGKTGNPALADAEPTGTFRS